MTSAKHPILIVDDEPEILFSLRGLLRNEFEVHTAESGALGLEILRQHPIHVIVVDQRMPQMTGVDFLKQAQEDWPDVVRIVLTGYADIQAAIAAINEGHVFRYLTKPCDPDELQKALRQACDLYDMNLERRQLLMHLDEYVGHSLKLLQEPSSAKPAPLAQTGASLREWLNRVLSARRDKPGK